MPLVIFDFNQINPWAIVAGILLAPFVVLALIGGMAKILLTLLWPSMSGTWAIAAAAPVAMMRHVLAWLAMLPGSEYPTPAMPLWMLLGIYALYLLFLVPMRRPKLKVLVKLIPVGACVAAVALPRRHIESAILPDEMRVTLLSLGAGQCAVVDTPAGRTMMIDAGSSSLSDLLGKCIQPYLRATGHTSIDTLLLTHSDYDHISAAGGVAQVYDVREVLVGGRFREHARVAAPGRGSSCEIFDALEHPAAGRRAGPAHPAGPRRRVGDPLAAADRRRAFVERIRDRRAIAIRGPVGFDHRRHPGGRRIGIAQRPRRPARRRADRPPPR